MQSLGSLHTTPTEGGSDNFTISESCVRSDIENIIKKMYTPRANKMSSNISQGFYHQVSLLESGGKYVTNQNNTSTTFSESSDNLDRRFGFYFHSRSGNEVDLQQLVVDASASDSVSLPQVRMKLKKNRVVCECCRRNISNRVRARSNRCAICDDRVRVENNAEVRSKTANPEVKTLHANVEMKKLMTGKGQGDVSESKVRVECQQCHEKRECHNSSAPALQDTHFSLLPHQNSCPLGNVCKESVEPIGVSSCENLQVVPNLDTGYFQENKPQNQFNITSNPKLHLERPNTTFFSRVISKLNIWSLIFYKSKVQNHKNPIMETNSSIIAVNSSQFQNQQENDLMLDGNKTNQIYLEYFGQSHHKMPDAQKSCDCTVERVVETHQIQNYNPVQSYHTKDKIIGEFSKTKSKSSDRKGNECLRDTSKSSPHIIHVGDFGVTEVKKGFPHVSQPKDKISCLFSKNVDSNNVNTNSKSCQTDESSHHLILTSELAQEDNTWASRLWAQAFQSCTMGGDFITAFILQTLKFFLHNLIRPLFCGTVEVWSDYFFKPLLTTLFSSILQPVLRFLQDVIRSLSDMCLPIAECCGHFCKEMCAPCGSWRLIEVHKTYNKYSDCNNKT